MIRFVVLLTMMCLAIGCSRTAVRPDQEYQTVGNDPNRDTDLARKENARAVELIERAEFDEAEKVLKRALAADMMFGPAHNSLGTVYLQQAKLYLAAWEFEYAIKLMPHQPEPHYNLGMVYESADRPDKSIDAYNEALRLAPDNPEILGNLARALLRKGEKGDQVRELLSKLMLHDSRPEWVAWAREQQVLLPKPSPQ